MESSAYINGKFINGEKRYSIISPINLKECGSAPALSKVEIDFAFDVAKKSQYKWKNFSREERIDFIENFVKKLREKKEEIAKVIVFEVGKTHTEAIAEIERTITLIIETIYAYHNQLFEHIKGSTVGVPEKMITIIREPLGVVLAISPFNYPINLSLSKIIPALISGNSVVFKPATNGSLTATFIAKIMDEIKIPAGVFNLITGKGSEIGTHLTNHPGANVITYTGSTKIGLEISKNSSMQNIILEMGGKDAALVLEDAQLEFTVKNIIKGAFSYSGQRCTAIKRVFVPKTIKESFETILKEHAKTITVGDSSVKEVLVGPLINMAAARFQKRLIKDAIEKGAKILFGGTITKNLVYPTILIDVNETMKIATEEQFGPVLPIIYYSNIDDAIQQINNSKYGLQASIYTNNNEDAVKYSNMINVGSVNINCPPSRGPDQLPFTGVKHSGFGVQGVKYAIESMTRPKNVVFHRMRKRKLNIFKK